MKKNRRLMAEINVVPYIDVMLVLLIIFMITAPLLTQGVQVQLPEADATPIAEAQQAPIIISLDAQTQLYFSYEDQTLPVDAEQLADEIAVILQKSPQTQVLIQADRHISYGEVMQAMVLAQQAGAQQIGLLTEALE